MVAQPGAAKFLGADSHPIPWVFLVLPDEFDVTGKAEELHGLEPALIHLFRDGQHRSRPHPQSPEAQLPIAQCRIDEMNLIHAVTHEVMYTKLTWSGSLGYPTETRFITVLTH